MEIKRGTNSSTQYQEDGEGQEETLILASGSLKVGPRGKCLSSAGAVLALLSGHGDWKCQPATSSFSGATFPG